VGVHTEATAKHYREIQIKSRVYVAGREISGWVGKGKDTEIRRIEVHYIHT
jgi:hypothetical protein